MKGYFGTSYSEEGSLAHYGVKGMKWGVRRDRSSVSKRQQRKTSKMIEKKSGYADRNIAEIKRRSKLESQQLDPFINGSNKRYSNLAKGYKTIGKRHFDAVISAEETYKKRLADIDVTTTTYRNAKKLISTYENEYQNVKNLAERDYFIERNQISRKYAS